MCIGQLYKKCAADEEIRQRETQASVLLLWMSKETSKYLHSVSQIQSLHKPINGLIDGYIITILLPHYETFYCLRFSLSLCCDTSLVLSFPGFKGVTVKWCHALNSVDCSTCSYTSLYPLSHYIHINDDYWSTISVMSTLKPSFFIIFVAQRSVVWYPADCWGRNYV